MTFTNKKIYYILIQFFSLFVIIFSSHAQDSGLKEIVKSHQDKITSVEKSLKTLIGKIETVKNNTNSIEFKNIENTISTINENLKILESKIQTLTQFSYKLEFEVKRLEAHLNLSSSYPKENKSKVSVPSKPKLKNNDKKISKEGLQSKSEGVLGFIKEKNDKKVMVNVEDSKKITSPTKNADDQFKTAKSFLAKRNYVQAEKAFQDFISKNKNHKNTADAHYWLGRIYYIQKKYSEAAIALAEFNTLYPDDKRLQETTLLIAESATKFAPKEQICGILTQTRDFMTNPSTKFTKRITSLINKNNCSGE